MTVRQQEIDELFSMFHDFEIIKLTYNGNILNLTIHIPWGQMWNDPDYLISVELTGCDFMYCDYAEVLNTPENLAKRWVDQSHIDKSTNDQQIISEIGLEVQRHEFDPPNKYKFICNSSKNTTYGGGQLTFTADNYKIFNKEGIQIDLYQMEKWGSEGGRKFRKHE